MRQRRPDLLEELLNAKLLVTHPSFPSVHRLSGTSNSAPSLLPQGFQEPLTISVILRTRTRRPLPPRCHHRGLCTPWQLLWQHLPQPAYGGAGELLTQAGAPPTAHALLALPRNRQTRGLRHTARPPYPALLPALPPFSRHLTWSLWHLAGCWFPASSRRHVGTTPRGPRWGDQSYALGEGS